MDVAQDPPTERDALQRQTVLPQRLLTVAAAGGVVPQLGFERSARRVDELADRQVLLGGGTSGGHGAQRADSALFEELARDRDRLLVPIGGRTGRYDLTIGTNAVVGLFARACSGAQQDKLLVA